MSHHDALIIGSGISGLTSAALLSKKGKSVLVLEAYSRPGGYMHSFRRFGELFDTGAHYVGSMCPGQPFHTLLNYLGVYKPEAFVPLNPDGFDVFHFPEGTIRLPMGFDRAAQELASHFPSETAAIKSYFDLIQKTVAHFPTYSFDGDADMTRSLEALQTPLTQVVEPLTQNPRLQALIYAYCGLHGVRPEDTPFGLHAIVVDSLIRGPMGFSKGGDDLTRTFVERIEAQGGRVLMNRKVVSLVVNGDNVSEVVTEKGERFTADWVISSLHPKTTFGLLTDDSRLTGLFKDRVRQLPESGGMYAVYARAQGLDWDPLQNHYFFDTSDPKEMFRERGPDEIPAMVFASLSRTSSNEGGKKVFSLHSASPYKWFERWKDTKYGKRPDDYKAFKDKLTARVFAAVERYEPGFAAKIESQVSSSPLSNLHFNGSIEGSGYGLYHSIQNTGARAIGPRTKILNLLVTGQNYLFPGLLGASISSLRTCGHIIGIKPVLEELKELGERS